MANRKHQGLLVAALCFSGLALLLHIIGFATPYWYSQELGSITVHMGLWKGCFSISGFLSAVCKDYSLWDSDLECEFLFFYFISINDKLRKNFSDIKTKLQKFYWLNLNSKISKTIKQKMFYVELNFVFS